MEFDASTSKPPSTKLLLYQQVEEQSDFCDVTVQVGTWEKKFHLCVLVMSPFFECIRRSNFKEKQTGLVKLEFATPVATDAAIMFLYGKRPNVTVDNAAEILELAEFLLIPSLKSKCVAFFKKVPITNENCLKMLQISSLYGFEFPQCYDYIRANLPEILRKEEAVFLTKESVLTLLTDPLLSYVLAEEKFEFAIRWARASQLNRDAFEDVFKAIDIESMDREFLETVVLQDPLVVSEMRIAIPDLRVRMPNGDHRVLIFPNLLINNKIVCFDIESERWSGIVQADLPEDSPTYDFRNAPVLSTRRPRVVCRVSEMANRCKLYLQDLHLKEYTVNTVFISEDTEQGNKFSAYDLSRDMFVAISNERTDIHRSTIINKRFVRRREYVHTAVLYCGKIQHQDTCIYPIFTIRNTDVASVCINENNEIALLTMKKDTLHIYDISSCQLETIALKDHVGVGSYGGLRVAPKEDGFVLYNKDTVLDISRLNGQDLTERYAVQTTHFGNDRHGDRSIYIYSNNIWFRILKRKGRSNVEVSSANHGTLMTVSPKEVVWNKLPSPPKDIEILERHDAFIVELPKSMLRCHFNCPHCPQLLKNQLEQRLQKRRLRELSLVSPAGAGRYLYSDEDDNLSDDYHYHDDYRDDYNDNDYYDNDCYDNYYDNDRYFYSSD